VRGVVFSNQKILLVKERSDGKWTLPGGWADINESASEAVKREVWEESGFDVQVVKLLAFSDKQKHDHPPHLPHTYKAFFLCQIVDGKPTPSVETSAVEFFTDNNLPDLSLPRVTPKQIARIFEHAANLDWPTDFD
jgi:ADP-ribose pyrophosphatase YjhB (NUDIX family)